MDRLLTVKDAMQIIPLGKTKVTQIINTLPHINTGGKLLVSMGALEMWVRENMVAGNAEKKAVPPPRKRVKVEGLTEDGLIPYRKTKKGA